MLSQEPTVAVTAESRNTGDGPARHLATVADAASSRKRVFI